MRWLAFRVTRIDSGVLAFQVYIDFSEGKRRNV
jgi:hypothetical protein